LRDSLLKNPSQKRAGRLAQGVDPEFKPQYRKKRKKEKSMLAARVCSRKIMSLRPAWAKQ
jgi:hypothetical protein